jgi:hypothetical protein
MLFTDASDVNRLCFVQFSFVTNSNTKSVRVANGACYAGTTRRNTGNFIPVWSRFLIGGYVWLARFI